jgi:hypothetical protein
MRDWAAIRERYLRDKLPVRLGGLAANLARVGSFSRNAVNREVVNSLLEESKLFIEWTAGETDTDTAAQLIELQIQLARWQLDWDHIWANQGQRASVAEQCRTWSDRILEFSGVLK